MENNSDWWEQLDKKRGSRPRAVGFMNGSRSEIAEQLNALINLKEVTITSDDRWMPKGLPVQDSSGHWDVSPADELRLDKPNELVSPDIQEALKLWC